MTCSISSLSEKDRLTPRELATLRAALHCWQNELSYYTREELQTYYPDLKGIEPLSLDAVDMLIQKMARAES